MKQCKKCGQPMAEGARFCACCGAKDESAVQAIRATPRERKLDVYVAEHFGGDMHKALVYLLNTTDAVNLDTFVDELTTEEADFVYDRMREYAIEQYGGLKNYRAELKKQRYLLLLDMTEKEAKKSTVNPFKKPLLLRLALIMVCAVVTGLSSPLASLLGTTAETIAIGGGLAISCIALSMSDLIGRCWKYRWVKKRLDAERSAQKELDA